MSTNQDFEKINQELLNIAFNCYWIESYLVINDKIDSCMKFEHLSDCKELFITIEKALTEASIIALARIYDINSKGTNLDKILKNACNEIPMDEDKYNEIKIYCRDKRRELNNSEYSELLYNLRKWRIKYYAHTDIEFLNNEINLRNSYKINLEEFKKLINFAKRTSEHLYFLINDVSIINSVTIKCEKGFDLLIKIIEVG